VSAVTAGAVAVLSWVFEEASSSEYKVMKTALLIEEDYVLKVALALPSLSITLRG
jgi:hypothetical protein